MLARVAIGEHDGQSVVIKRRADVESALNVAEAARILHTSPGAMELRRLEALQNLSGKTSKVICDLAKGDEQPSRTRVAAMAAAMATDDREELSDEEENTTMPTRR